MALRLFLYPLLPPGLALLVLLAALLMAGCAGTRPTDPLVPAPGAQAAPVSLGASEPANTQTSPAQIRPTGEAVGSPSRADARDKPHAASPAASRMQASADSPVVSLTGEESWEFLTGGRTFERLTADQRWPVFSASYRFQSNAEYLYEYEAVSIGDTVALARGPVELDHRVFEMELGVQGAVFAAFNPHSPSQDLINADYVASGYVAARRGRVSGMLRLWHLSGHVGDEFLLSDLYPNNERRNFRFEAAQLLGSYDFPRGVRIYGGPTYMIEVEPADFPSWQIQYGLEFKPDYRLADMARPIVAADVRMLGGLGYDPDLSLRGGLSFDRGRRGPAFQVLGEFYIGRDPNGQFYDDRVLFTGIGLHLQL